MFPNKHEVKMAEYYYYICIFAFYWPQLHLRQ